MTNLETLSFHSSGFALRIPAVLCLGIMVNFLTPRYPTPGRRLGEYERANGLLKNDEDEDLVEQLKRQCCEWVAYYPPRLMVD